MASELRVNTLKDASGNNSVATSYVKEGAVKCFVVQSGGTPTNHDSLNISSITDQTNDGVFQTAFTNAFDSIYFRGAYTGGNTIIHEARNTTGQSANTSFGARTTSSCITAHINTSSTRFDADEQKIWWGDLA